MRMPLLWGSVALLLKLHGLCCPPPPIPLVTNYESSLAQLCSTWNH